MNSYEQQATQAKQQQEQAKQQQQQPISQAELGRNMVEYENLRSGRQA